MVKKSQNNHNESIRIDIDENLKHELIFRIGRVHSVSGRDIKVEVFKDKNHPYLIYNGKVTKNVSTGSYIKVKKGLTTIVGKITGEDIDEDVSYSESYNKKETKIRRFLNVSLLGHYENGSFLQGIKELPLIDNECYALEEEDFDKLHNFFEEGDKTISLGGLSEDPSHTIKAGIDKLFASHIGIFGNTGSGKSNTLARIYTELFEATDSMPNFKKKSHFVFIDFNGEYTRPKVLSDKKKVFNLNTRKRIESIRDDEKYTINSKVLQDAEILSVLLHATEKTQKPFLASALESKFLDNPSNYAKSAISTIKTIIDRKQPSVGKEDMLSFLNKIKDYVEDASAAKINSLISEIENHFGQMPNGTFMWDNVYNLNGVNIWTTHAEPKLVDLKFKDLKLIDAMQLRIYLHYYHRISISSISSEYVGHLINRVDEKFKTLKKVIKIDDGEIKENIMVVSFRGVRLEMRKILPMIICKHLYEFQKEKNDVKDEVESSLHIIIDEAHNVLSEQSERESDHWKDYRLETFEEIIKEGRKFGTFMTISSQRPFDISQTIISQLHNYFIHRLINNNDLNAVRRAVAYLDDLSFDTIPILSVGSCFFAGLATDIPIKINVDQLDSDRRPKSDTVKLTDIWS